jgi:DNA-damage-inducible protein D
MSDLELFMNEFSGDNFERFSHENSFTFWYASDLMKLLGYENMTSFQRAINKAMTTCNTLNIPIMDNFLQVQAEGRQGIDFKLSRFACYLTVMNADGKKPSVAMAQAYFATLAGAVHNYLEEANRVERLVIREEVSERESSLSGVAHRAGVENYGYFQNAGYRGMYNKNIRELKRIRSIPDNKSLLDYMGKEELAANLFRITQTELKIKQENIFGQKALENTAETVGKKVRSTMKEISGMAPEQLPPQEEIKAVKSHLKARSKEIKALDKPAKKKK